MYQELKNKNELVRYTIAGKKDGPLVVCVHGIMGSSQDFSPFIDIWGKDYQLLIVDIGKKQQDRLGYGIGGRRILVEEKYSLPDIVNNSIEEPDQTLVYALAPAAIIEHLDQNFDNRPLSLVGISFGGKVCYEIAQSIPDRIRTVIATDVGLGSLCGQSQLFRHILNVIPTLNLEQPWKSLRKEIAEKVHDRMLCILLHNHLEYKDNNRNLASWKAGAKSFFSLLKKSPLEDQWGDQGRMKASVLILSATVNSAIEAKDLIRMKELPNFQIEALDGASHFIHVHRSEEFRNRTLDWLDRHYKETWGGLN